MGRDFDTYHDFASSNLDEIYDPDDLASSLHLTTNCLESGIYRNNGDGTFTWQTLPRMVQQSPGYGVAVIDLDADGYLDLAITQNFFTMQAETGLLRGGMGVILHGSAGGSFTAMSPDASGMVVFGDGKGLAVLDADHDGRPDLLAIQNNDVPVLLTDAGHHGRNYLYVRLEGPAGNPTGIGARVTATYVDGHTQALFVAAGGGYLSQSSAALAFGHPEGNPVTAVSIVWPDGTTSEEQIEPGNSSVRLTPNGTDR
ncbi:CRTAC1 family protein [Phycisphaeraceae bacterium D3-23]